MSNEQPDYLDRIVQDPKILVGKPTVRGTRIPVELVLRHLEENPDLGELFAAFPRLTPEDVRACLAYARRAVERKRPRSEDTSTPQAQV
jgi:uncharacterized protein (DUF433 family)